jgi:GDSL-like Lipase/Acylhydrolase family
MAAWGPTLRHVFLDLVNPKSSRSGVLLWMLHLLAGSENRRDMQMTHIVLLGDSIFDNSPYTAGGPDVISQVRQLLPVDWRATLLAVDGATTKDVAFQLRRLPQDASHLVLSVGGNDALMSSGILRTPADCTAQAVSALGDISQRFEERYRSAVGACRQIHVSLTLCTIYNGCFPDAIYQRLVSTALMVFNDVILRVGIEFGLTMIDLRFVCSSAADYANPIEPSSIGGAKIARANVNSVSSVHPKNSGARVAI